MHILFISWWWPYPANNGSKIRIYNLLRHLSAAHQVTLLSFAESDEATSAQLEHLQQFCSHVESVSKPHYQPKTLRATLGYLSPWPRSLVDVYSETMEKRVEEVVRHTPPDFIIASQIQTLRYLDLAPAIPAILEEIEVTGFHNLVESAVGTARRFRAQLTLTKMNTMVRTLANRGVAFTVVSEAEKTYIRDVAPNARIELIPNGVDTAANQPDPKIPPKPLSLIYTGAVTYSANYEAVRYFVHEVLPLVRARVPEAQLTITGGTGDVDVRELAAQPGVKFSGYLPSPADAIRQSWALVVPLRSGGGTRLKILEAMALGTAVVSTHKGAEGLAVEGEKHLLLADSPSEMADAICRLFADADLRTQLTTAGRMLVEKQYDWSIISQQLLHLIDEINPAPAITH
jgi:glycosyltransferase involved in cell wall biosynthesis